MGMLDGFLQAPEGGGLLGNLDPQSRSMMGLLMLSQLNGGGQGKGNMMSSMLPMMMQAQQAKRLQQNDAIRAQEFLLNQEKFGWEKQKYEREMEEYQRKKAMQDELAGSIEGEVVPESIAMATGTPALERDNNVAVNTSMPVAGQSNTEPASSVSLFDTSDTVNNSPDLAIRKKRAAALARAGDTKGAMDLLKPDISETTTSKELAKLDAQTLGKQREASMVAQDMLTEIQDFKRILNNTNEFAVGPLASKFGMNELYSDNAQMLNQIGSNLTLQARRLLQMPASGFSDADRKFLTKATLNTSYDKKPLLHIADKIEKLAQKAIAKNRYYEQELSKKGTLSGSDYKFYQGSNQLEQWANEAVQKGADPAAVKAKLAQLRGY